MISLRQATRAIKVCQSAWCRSFNSSAFVTRTVPIDDLSVQQRKELGSEAEKRCTLASLYRLVHQLNYDYEIYSHISLRVAGEEREKKHAFLINPFGLQYDEITASSLVKIDQQGNIISRGSTPLGVNKAGWILHGAIHEARPDVQCIIHVHAPAAVAVASTESGLLPINQEALILHNVSYHPYFGIVIDDLELNELRKNFPAPARVLILRNHGLLVAGSTPFEAWFYLFTAMRACLEQAQLLAVPHERLAMPSQLSRDRTAAVVRRVIEQGMKAGGVNMKSRSDAGDVIDWGIGELEFESWMRKLDRMGLKTGYPYRLKLPSSIFN